MRAFILALALVLPVVAVAEPTAESTPVCDYFSSQGTNLMGAYFLRHSRHRCTTVFPTYTVLQRVEIVRVSQGGESGPTVAQLDFFSNRYTYTDGREVTEHWVALHDATPVGHTRAMYKDERAGSACNAKAYGYSRDAHRPVLRADLPMCIPKNDLLP